MDDAERKTIYVIGEDPFNFERLRHVDHAAAYDFQPLFRFDEVQNEGRYPLRELHEQAVERLDRASKLDGIIGYWDFPVTSLVPILTTRYELPGPTLNAVLQCEHKVWARLMHQRAIPEATPRFCAVDPFDDDALSNIELGFPFWLKPVKSHSSQLGYMIRGREDLRHAIEKIRKGIDRFAEPFRFALDRVERPDEIAHVDGRYCIAEQIIGGNQCTAEGYVHDGRCEVYAIVDSVRHSNQSSFTRYDYPSRLPKRIRARIRDLSARIMQQIGYDNATFNAEYFWDQQQDEIWLLEVNPRLSQSHSFITEKVDGVPNLDKMVQLSVGRKPRNTHRQGPYARAGKFFIRSFDDGRVVRTPEREEVERLENELPGVAIEVQAKVGTVLSRMQNQDSYSYELALVHVAGANDRELREKFQICKNALHFELLKMSGDRARSTATQAAPQLH